MFPQEELNENSSETGEFERRVDLILERLVNVQIGTYFSHHIHLRDDANSKEDKVHHKMCVVMTSFGDR